MPIFTTMMISTFNMIFTACPIVAYAVLEQDLEKETILSHPETYNVTRTMTKQSFFRWDGHGCRRLRVSGAFYGVHRRVQHACVYAFRNVLGKLDFVYN